MPNTTFHLRTDVFETFHSLVTADIYVMSVGSWSILTAHLSKGIKITTGWNEAWNEFPSNLGIIQANKQGAFNVSNLRENMEKRSWI